MARAATTTDAFNAVAEPRRRQILDLLSRGELAVNHLVELLDLAQPQVSRHLRVLRQVGLVEVRDVGRQRVYRLNGRSLKPIHDWVSNFEQLWSQRYERLDSVLAELKEKEDEDECKDEQRDGSGHAPERHPDPDHAGVQRTQASGLPRMDDA